MSTQKHTLSMVNTTAMTATCAVCGPIGIRMHKARGYPICRGKEKLDRQRYRYRHRKHAHNRIYKQKLKGIKFNLTIDEVVELQRRRTHKCPICLKKVIRMDLDHDHDTGEYRGWLCRSCNVGLGHFEDDPDRLIRAAKYLAP